jgi:hypothetical protein
MNLLMGLGKQICAVRVNKKYRQISYVLPATPYN